MFLVRDVVPSRRPTNPSQGEPDRSHAHTQTHDAPVALREKPSPTEVALRQVLSADGINRAPGTFVVRLGGAVRRQNRARIEGLL